MKTSLIKPAIYYRVSTTKQGIESQKPEVEAFIREHGLDPSEVPVYADIGCSGKDLNRPQFQKMLADAQQGKIKNIIVYKLDRFSRSANTAIRLILELDDYGVGFSSATQPVLQLGTEIPFRRTILAAFAEIAQIERESIVERIKSGLTAAKKRGVKLGPKFKMTNKIQDEILDLSANGLSIRQISKQVGFSRYTVHQIIKEAS